MKVIIVDRFAPFRVLLRKMLISVASDISVVELADVGTIRASVNELQPDIVFLGMSYPDENEI